MPDAYERLLVPTLFEPFAIDLAGRVAARQPRRILELAAGTGVVTRQLMAACPSAEVIATDLNRAMVELGRAQVPHVSWRAADATMLPFADDGFDVVACQFGVMFFPDKPAAFAEARRVLAPGGAFLFNVWTALDGQAFAGAVDDALEKLFPADPPPFLGAVPYAYDDVDVVMADLRAAGFDRATVETLVLDGSTPSAADVAIGFCTGTPLRGEIASRGDLDASIGRVADDLTVRFGAGPVTGRMTAHVIEATPA